MPADARVDAVLGGVEGGVVGEFGFVELFCWWGVSVGMEGGERGEGMKGGGVFGWMDGGGEGKWGGGRGNTFGGITGFILAEPGEVFVFEPGDVGGVVFVVFLAGPFCHFFPLFPLGFSFLVVFFGLFVLAEGEERKGDERRLRVI